MAAVLSSLSYASLAPTAEDTTTQQSEFFGPGISVEVGKIQRELKKLWQQSDQMATRASRLNLVIYHSGESSIRANTALVEKIARQHAIRAIIIAAKPQLPGNHIRAWVNAHCQINQKGAKQRCSEQIAFELTGEARQQGLTPNIILGHLDSDLPMYFWRQGEFANPSEQLMAWVDRLIFDSAEWPKPAEQFAILHKISKASDLEPEALADLNWTRLAGLRFAVAQFFDAPDALASLDALESVEIVHHSGEGVRTRALLLVGWLASRLGWQRADGNPLDFRSANGGAVTVKLTADANDGEGIRRVTLQAAGDGGDFTVSRDARSDFYNTCAHCGSRREQRQLLPVGPEDTAALVSAELVHGGGHGAYLRALEMIEGAL